VPWIAEFGDMNPMLDPTFINAASLETPSSCLPEAVHEAGAYRRQLFMGLPYYAVA
jgi:hypothetical protein